MCIRDSPPIVLGSEQGGAEVAFDLGPTLTASAGMSGNNRPVLFENHSQDGRYRGPLTSTSTKNVLQRYLFSTDLIVFTPYSWTFFPHEVIFVG